MSWRQRNVDIYQDIWEPWRWNIEANNPIECIERNRFAFYEAESKLAVKMSIALSLTAQKPPLITLEFVEKCQKRAQFIDLMKNGKVFPLIETVRWTTVGRQRNWRWEPRLEMTCKDKLCQVEVINWTFWTNKIEKKSRKSNIQLLQFRWFFI